MAHSIRDAIEDGLHYYEFLRGDEHYKSRWTKRYRTTVTLMVGRSSGARAYIGLANLKDRIKHYVRGSGAPVTSAVERGPDVTTEQVKTS
jgi:CelD/BcsL family acetyltransferase involved in cellulose biosynthesis